MMTRVARGDLAVSFTRFLACLVVEMMAPSKVGFPGFHRFYCLENSSMCS